MTSAGLVVGGMLAYAAAGGASGATGAAAADDVTIKALGAGPTSAWDSGMDEPVEITTGDTVTWDFSDPSVPDGDSTHNVASTNAVAADPRWEPYLFPGPGDYSQAQKGATTEFTFYKAGTYTFTCKLHEFQTPSMSGTIVVTGADLPLPSPTPSPTPTATPSATATPSPTPPPHDDHLSTPPPSPEADSTKPALSRIKLRGMRRAARVTFTLSEHATVTLQVRKRGKKKVLRALAVQARAGTRTVVIRSPKLRKGRYTVALTARDAMGNKSATSTSALRIRK